MTLPKSLTTVTTFSKLFALWLFLFLPFAGFYLGIEYQLSQPNQTDQKYAVPSKPTSEITHSFNWKTYTNTLYQFSFEYPNTMDIKEGTDKTSIHVGDFINIYISNSDPENCRGDCWTVLDTHSTIINKIAAKLRTVREGRIGGGTPQTYKELIIPYKGKYLIVEVNQLSPDEISLENYLTSTEQESVIGQIPKIREVFFNKIVKSIKLLNHEGVNWKTYKNEKYGYSFQYPDNHGEQIIARNPRFIVQQNFLENVKLTPPYGSDNFLDVTVYNNQNNLSASSWFNKHFDDLFLDKTTRKVTLNDFIISTVTIHNTPFMKAASNQIQPSLYFVKKEVTPEKSYIIQLSSTMPEDILQTFTLIN